MILWRLTRDSYSNDLSGRGIALFGSRWTEKGNAALFTTTCPSLAILETLFSLPSQSYLNSSNYSLISILVPDEIKIDIISYEKLPKNWYQSPPVEKLKSIGTAWLKLNKFLCLEVPSRFAPYDKIVIINPEHDEFKKIKILSIEPYADFDNLSESLEVLKELNRLREKTVSKYKKNNFMKDVFICHASEDKKLIVEKIATDFQANNISIWLDKSEILWGDSIPEKVNEGLKISRYVIVILSKNFLKKSWPKREMNAALNLEATLGQKKVLPILVGNEKEREEILQELILQNDKLFMIWDGTTTELIYHLKQML